MERLRVTAPEQHLYVDELSKQIKHLSNLVYTLGKKATHYKDGVAKEMIKKRYNAYNRRLEKSKAEFAKENDLLKH